MRTIRMKTMRPAYIGRNMSLFIVYNKIILNHELLKYNVYFGAMSKDSTEFKHQSQNCFSSFLRHQLSELLHFFHPDKLIQESFQNILNLI